MVKLEICAGNIASAIAAQEGGADRIELCASLSEGGTTPSIGMIEVARQLLSIPIFVLIRPRAGDFLYTESELAVMEQDIIQAKKIGIDGIVVGIIDAEGKVNIQAMERMMNAAKPLAVTFHRAFDWTRNPFEAIEVIEKLGCSRILTSGQANTALDGAEKLAEMTAFIQANHLKLNLLVAGGIQEKNIHALLDKVKLSEVHASLQSRIPSQMLYQNNTAQMGKDSQDDWVIQTPSERVKEMKKYLIKWG